MTVFQTAARPSLRMEDNTKAGYGRNEKKVRGSHEMYYAPRPTRRTSTLLDLGPTPRTLLFSRRDLFFFSYVDTRWSC